MPELRQGGAYRPQGSPAAALGAWGGIGGLALALGPLVGGAVVSGLSWHWNFWINVPIGLVMIPLALRRLDETRGPSSRLDLPSLGLASVGLLGVVWGLVRGNGQGWTSPEIVVSLAAGVALLVAFVLWELRTETPMLPMRFFRNRTLNPAIWVGAAFVDPAAQAEAGGRGRARARARERRLARTTGTGPVRGLSQPCAR